MVFFIHWAESSKVLGHDEQGLKPNFFSKVTCFHKEENDENENKMTFDALLFEREELFAEIERVKQMESELERLEEK